MSTEQLVARVEMAERAVFHAGESAKYAHVVHKNYDAKLASLLAMYEARKAELLKDQATWLKQATEADAKLEAAQKALEEAKAALEANKKLSAAARAKLDAAAKAKADKELADQQAKYDAVRKKLAAKSAAEAKK